MLNKYKLNISFLESCVLAMVLLFVFWSLFYGRKALGSFGLGFDGQLYADMARNFFPYFIKHSLAHDYGNYYIHRILMPATVSLLSKMFDINLSNNITLIRLFCVVNFLSLIGAILIYFLISKYYAFKKSIRLIGFFTFFISFPVLCLRAYYPVFTDIPAMFFGFLLFYSYLKHSLYKFSVVALVSMFTFPPFFIVSSVLILFHAQQPEKAHDNSKFMCFRSDCCQFRITLPNILIKTLLIGLVSFLFVYAIITRIQGYNSLIYVQGHYALLGLPWVAIFLFFVLNPIFTKFKSFNLRLRYVNIILCLIVIGISHLITSWLAGPLFNSPVITQDLTFAWFLRQVLVGGSTFPMGNLVALFVYYGPIVILFSFLWAKVVSERLELGVGFFFVVCLTAIQLVNSEARCLIYIVPFYVIPLLIILHRLDLDVKLLGFFLIVSLIMSKFWLYIPKTMLPSEDASWFSFPKQFYLMNMGYTMSAFTYILQGCFLVLVSTLYIYYFKIHSLFAGLNNQVTNK